MLLHVPTEVVTGLLWLVGASVVLLAVALAYEAGKRSAKGKPRQGGEECDRE